MSDMIEVGGQQYRIGRLDAKKQFHVARRLAPLLAGLGGALQGESKGFTQLVTPIAEALSKMSDEDTDYVIDTCLAVVQRQSNNQWASVMVRNGGLMFQDIDMAQMLQLTVAVVQGNLGNFFPAGSSLTPSVAA